MTFVLTCHHRDACGVLLQVGGSVGLDSERTSRSLKSAKPCELDCLVVLRPLEKVQLGTLLH